MATITSIDPEKSKKSGSVTFSIVGTGFLTSDLSDDFTGAPFYTDTSTGDSFIGTEPDRLVLNIRSPGTEAGR